MVDVNNAIINVFFRSVLGNILQVLSIEQACKIGAVAEGNIHHADQKISYYCIYGPDMLKREDTNREELKMRKKNVTCFWNGCVAMASLQWLRCNGFIAMASLQ